MKPGPSALASTHPHTHTHTQSICLGRAEHATDNSHAIALCWQARCIKKHRAETAQLQTDQLQAYTSTGDVTKSHCCCRRTDPTITHTG